jgi:hypothetical protein
MNQLLHVRIKKHMKLLYNVFYEFIDLLYLNVIYEKFIIIVM